MCLHGRREFNLHCKMMMALFEMAARKIKKFNARVAE
jgi:hypothetical protein